MNFPSLKQCEISLCKTVNDSNNTPILKCPTPNQLRVNLDAKRVGIENLLITMDKIPRFIPEYGGSPNSSYFNYTAGSTSDTKINNPDFGVNILNYFVNVRKLDNSEAVTSYVTWTNPNNLQKPNNMYYTPSNVYYEPYYYSYNFMDFVTCVQVAINEAFTEILGAPITNPCIFQFDASSNTFILQMDNTYEATYDIEFSPNLKQLFNFQTSAVNLGYLTTPASPRTYIQSYLIQWSDFTESIGSVTYTVATCKISNTIYPFDLFILSCDLPINTIDFFSSYDNAISIDKSKKVLFMWRKDFDAIDMPVKLEINNEGVANKLKNFTANSFDNNYISFTFSMRTRRDNIYIDWVFQPSDKIEFTLNTYSLI